MPFNAQTTDWSLYSPAEKLRALADFMETLPPEKVNMGHVHCGTAHCAWGWADLLGMVPSGDAFDLWRDEMAASRVCVSPIFGFRSLDRFIYCFGSGRQFDYLNRPYTPADVARHLRETADDLEAADA